jgi:glyoxylase-like metal-dependent hydrolase (beta-lactamase superfamily II)
MTKLNRRTVLTGVISTGTVATLMPSALRAPVHAAAARSGQQAPGFYRYRVGEFEITQINDGQLTFPLSDGFVTNVSKDEAIAAAEAAYMTPKGSITIPFNPMVINTGSKIILIDTGYGAEISPTTGHLARNLAAAGFKGNEIDAVIISHLHADHITGLRSSDGTVAFPNAEIMVPARDWAFWMDDDNMKKVAGNKTMSEFFAATRTVLPALQDRIKKYDWDTELTTGITSLETAGHTPGHTSFAVASGNQRILVQSDVTIIPDLFLRHPDWHVAFDIDPVKAQATRHKFLDMAATEKAIVVGYHFPFPAVGHVEKDGPGYRLVPIAWNSVL